MSEPPRYPTQSDLHTPISSTASQSSVAFTPRSISVAEDSDSDHAPTPTHSPGGPGYDDLPPSYDEAREQAAHDARTGIAPIDPNQIEAHRLTLSEDPNGPEIWEYRVRGEQSEEADEQERAPEYVASAGPLASTVPIQHVQASENIPVGRVGGSTGASSGSIPSLDTLLSAALHFTQHQPDVDVQQAPRLLRCVAIPQEDLPKFSAVSGTNADAHFLRAYAKALNAHAVRPSEFTAFLDGLNALCMATNTTERDLLRSISTARSSTNIIRSYLEGANEAYFAPRGLRASLRSLADLLQSLSIPPAGYQRRDARLGVLDPTNSAEGRAQALHPWIEAIDINVPEPNAQALALVQMSAWIRNGNTRERDTSRARHAHDDPPHSIPEDLHPDNGQRNSDSGRNGPVQPGNEWAALGQDMGRWGQEFGKMMGQWGQQFGKDMSVRGQQFGRNASAWGQGISAGASGSGHHTQSASMSASRSTQDDRPPLYSTGQESGLIFQDDKVAPASPPTLEKSKGKEKARIQHDDNDSSSFSSDSSDSDSDTDSDSDDDEFPDTQATFLKRLKSIEKQTEESTKKGKKTADEIARDRATAIAAAQAEKAAMDKKIEGKLSKRAARRDLNRRRHELKRAHRQKKREMRAAHDRKGKGKAKKSQEWKEAKKEYRDQRKELKKEKKAVKKEWQDEKKGVRKGQKEDKRTSVSDKDIIDNMVWVVIENLNP